MIIRAKEQKNVTNVSIDYFKSKILWRYMVILLLSKFDSEHKLCPMGLCLFIFKLRLGALIPRSVGLSVCPPKMTENIYRCQSLRVGRD